MPTYGYKCKECEHEFELLKKVTDRSIEVCPKCGSSTKRVFHPVGIIFKGSGFYSTDYRTKTPKGDGDGDAKVETDKKSEPKNNGEKSAPTKKEKPS